MIYTIPLFHQKSWTFLNHGAFGAVLKEGLQATDVGVLNHYYDEFDSIELCWYKLHGYYSVNVSMR